MIKYKDIGTDPVKVALPSGKEGVARRVEGYTSFGIDYKECVDLIFTNTEGNDCILTFYEEDRDVFDALNLHEDNEEYIYVLTVIYKKDNFKVSFHYDNEEEAQKDYNSFSKDTSNFYSEVVLSKTDKLTSKSEEISRWSKIKEK